jgi:hypothetical protein
LGAREVAFPCGRESQFFFTTEDAEDTEKTPIIAHKMAILCVLCGLCGKIFY